MDYKSKYTASEIDAKLSQVFNSTLQVKEVEVSEDITITPDEGFLGLKEVNVKVNAQQGGGENGNSWKYYDFTSASSQPDPTLIALCVLIKTNAGTAISPSAVAFVAPYIPTINAMAFNMSLMIASRDDGLLTLEEYINKYNLMSLIPKGATEITKEEFYTLNE